MRGNQPKAGKGKARTVLVVLAAVTGALVVFWGCWKIDATNTYFSAMGMIGMVFAVWMQKVELGLQRKELVENRKEVKEATKAQENSAKALDRQFWIQAIAARIHLISSELRSLEDELSDKANYQRMMPDIKRRRETLWRKQSDLHNELDALMSAGTREAENPPAD